MMTFILSVALLLDLLLKEPTHFHPLVGFGRLANSIEKRLNIGQSKRLKGVAAVSMSVLPFILFGIILERLTQDSISLKIFTSSLILYIAIGWQSLILHAKKVSAPLSHGNLTEARLAVAMIVSRDTNTLTETDIAKAATESILENGADALFSAIFWFCLLGIPGVILYRLSNTLDAMWGYKTSQFRDFGWAAARLDDILNFVPARLTALSYALVGNTKLAMECWRDQGFNWKSPNAGPVMAAGAGALNVTLGGTASYHDQPQFRPTLGPESTLSKTNDEKVDASYLTITRACTLVNRALLLWVTGFALLEFML